MAGMTGAAKKLPKAERRSQLLETARTIMREEGTDALSLGHVAGRAGVSKPIAYEHFGSRAGLLMALCHAYDREQVEAQRAALAAGGKTLADVARIFAEAFVACVLRTGPEMGAAFAALSGTDETADFRQSLREGYIAEFSKGFGGFVDMPEETGKAIYAGFLGAAEALSQDAAAGRVSREGAVQALTTIFINTLDSFQARPRAV